ncbi:hypothetical protein NDU88_007977 [Pleurodeles waltl]|uniref:Reverse transcriptase n=1 Tax=Pleurodeles waltl TaxID=8319 RepID=A0AAV7NY10_PLEWA|nr:hypothetical protein NDU88_007977 [Pleurodeles waltl]
MPKKLQNATAIKTIFDEAQGRIVDQAKEIGKVIFRHYMNLYTRQTAAHDDSIIKYLESVSMPCLSEELQAALIQPITKLELAEAIKDSPIGKAPGEDGLPAEFYKVMLDQITHVLATLFNTILNGQKVPGSFIVSFLKKGKPGDKPDSYHPISHLNSD